MWKFALRLRLCSGALKKPRRLAGYKQVDAEVLIAASLPLIFTDAISRTSPRSRKTRLTFPTLSSDRKIIGVHDCAENELGITPRALVAGSELAK